jgi:signal transduction histidine kinase
MAVVTLLYTQSCPVFAQSVEKNVLIIFSGVRGNNTEFLDLVEPSIRARSSGQINFFDAALENFTFPGNSQRHWQAYTQSMAETFRRRYTFVKFDLVITSGTPALQFAIQYREKIFPGAPIVFTQIGTREFEGQTFPGATGLTVPVGLRETIELALRLHPDAKQVAVIAGWDKYWLGAAQAELLRYQDKVKEIDFVGPASPELLDRAAALPPHTVVLFQLSPSDDRPAFGALDVLTAIAEKLPTYSAWPQLCLNHGCIGGAFADIRKEALEIGEIAARVLSGERPGDIPIEHSSYLQTTVDWRALRRWNIPESALPEGSVVLFRAPDFWEKYRRYVIGGIVILVFQSVLIVALALGAHRRQKLVNQLKDLSRRLIDAQEGERRRIARELHDDLNQRVVLLQSHIEASDASVNGHLSNKISELSREARDISTGISHLSHQLHSSALDILGLEPALRGLVRDLSLTHNLHMDFVCEDQLVPFSAEVQLCLFRVAQEALSNAVKHSGAGAVEVVLCHNSREKAVTLSVRDNGKGFDPQKLQTDSLGLISMRERLRLVDGELLIHSSPTRGTEVIANVRIEKAREAAVHA